MAACGCCPSSSTSPSLVMTSPGSLGPRASAALRLSTASAKRAWFANARPSDTCAAASLGAWAMARRAVASASATFPDPRSARLRLFNAS